MQQTAQPRATDCSVAEISSAGRRARVFYASGPGDNIGTYRHWCDGRDDPSEPIVPYSGQFYDLCRELDLEAFVFSTCPRSEELIDGRLHIEQRPNRLSNSRGIWFHLGQIHHGCRLMLTALRFKADVAIVGECTHWWMLGMLRMAGVRVIPSLHVRMARPGRPKGVLRRLIQLANRRFFRRGCEAILVASHRIEADLRLPPDREKPQVVPFLPLYRRETFESAPAPDWRRRPFRVLYVGRIEANKGVFDLLEAAGRVQGLCTDVHFEVCGSGSMLDELRRRVTEAGLDGLFALHGHCDRAQLLRRYGEAHVVVVPTRSDIGEGFNQVTIESVLAGRPVITSSLCPAVVYVSDAVVQVPPDNPAAYAEAILQLSNDKGAYDEKQQACRACGELFHDSRNGWAAAVKMALAIVDKTAPQVTCRRNRLLADS